MGISSVDGYISVSILACFMMRMYSKLRAVVALAFVATRVLAGQYHCYEGTMTNGLKLQLCFYGTSGQPSAGDEMWYQFIAETNQPPFRVYILKPAYQCTIEVANGESAPVPKTREGKKYGRLFGEARPVEVAIDKDKRGSRLCSLVTPNGSGRFRLPRCNELFTFEERGEYSFKIQMQVIREVVRDESRVEFELVRCAPLKITIRKE